MSWNKKGSSIVSYPDSDDEHDPLNYIRKPRQFSSAPTKNKVDDNKGDFKYQRIYGGSRTVHHKEKIPDVRNIQGNDEEIHYRKVYDQTRRPTVSTYESAESRWKKYKTEKAAELVKAERYQSAESGWKKLKSENKWDTSTWAEGSDSDDDDLYHRKAPKSKIDIFSDPKEQVDMFSSDSPKETERGKDFWWKYKDDSPVPNLSDEQRIFKADERSDDLFDDILSGNLVDGQKGSKTQETDRDFNDDFLYEEAILQSRRLLEETRAALGEGKSDSYENLYEDSEQSQNQYTNQPNESQYRQDERRDSVDDPVIQQNRSNYGREDWRGSYNETNKTQNEYTSHTDYNFKSENEYSSQEDKRRDSSKSQSDYYDRDDDSLYKTDERMTEYRRDRRSSETRAPTSPGDRHTRADSSRRQYSSPMQSAYLDEDDTWSRSITVQKKGDNWSDESLSPIRRDDSSPERKDSAGVDNLSPISGASEKDFIEKVSFKATASQHQPTEPIARNPYDNPELNITTIGRFFDDLMEWNYSHRCLICDKEFSDLQKWVEHIHEAKHGIEFHLDPYRCPPCHQVFRSKQEWKMHMAYSPSHGFMGSINVPKPQTILPPSPAFPVQHGWRCKACFMILQDEHEAVIHIKMTHLIHTAQYPCPLCGQPFWFQQDLDLHADQMHAPPKFSCDLCHRAFESSEKLQTHRLIKHSRKIKCYKCEKDIDELIFKEHCEMHKLESMLKCDYCGDMFRDHYLLDKHKRREHDRHRRRRRSPSFSPERDKRSSRRRSRRSSSPSKRSSSRHRESKAQKNEPKAMKEPHNEKYIDQVETKPQEDTSVPSSACETPAHSEEDIAPPGDDDYKHSSSKPENKETINELDDEIRHKSDESRFKRYSRDDADMQDDRRRKDKRYSSEKSMSRGRSRSRERSRSHDQSRSPKSRKKRSSRKEKRKHSNRKSKDGRSRSRSSSRSSKRKYERSHSRSPSRPTEMETEKQPEEREVEMPSQVNVNIENEEELFDGSRESALNNIRKMKGLHVEDTTVKAENRKERVKSDDIWERGEEISVDNTSVKDRPIFDDLQSKSSSTLELSSESLSENATWVVEKSMDEDKNDGSDNEFEKKQFVCKECGKSLNSLTQLRDHFTVKHKKGYNLRTKKLPASDVKKSQPLVAKEPALSDEQKEIAKLIEGIE